MSKTKERTLLEVRVITLISNLLNAFLCLWQNKTGINDRSLNDHRSLARKRLSIMVLQVIPNTSKNIAKHCWQ